MPAKVNLKKYLPVDGKWQFFPVLKVDGKPRPGTLVLKGKNKPGTEGTFYIEGAKTAAASTTRRFEFPRGARPMARQNA